MSLFSKIKARHKKNLKTAFKSFKKTNPLLQTKHAFDRSKTLRKTALIAGAAVGAFYAAPYALTAGKAALASGKLAAGAKFAGGTLVKKLYKPPINGMNARAAENTPTENMDLVQQLYGPDVNSGVGARQAVGVAALSTVPASCASVGGTGDDLLFVIAVATIAVVCLAPYVRRAVKACFNAPRTSR